MVDVNMHNNTTTTTTTAPNSGAVFAFDDAGGAKYGLDTTGNYLIVKNGANDYDAYVVSGDGTGTPYAITSTKIDLTLSDTDVTETGGAITAITDLIRN